MSKQTQRHQDRCHEWGQKNSHAFFVAFQPEPSYYEYSYYPDIPAFMEAYAKVPEPERCFFEKIHEGHACNEYYDIDWHIESDEIGEDRIGLLEQQVFAEFLMARNQYATAYPVTNDQCRILSASSSSKLSLHIVIPTHVFKDNNLHMKASMTAFQHTRSTDNDLRKTCQSLKHIDMGVYSKNRCFRILGSHKRSDPSRVLVRAGWHQASVQASDAQFFITNVHPDCITVTDMPTTRKMPSPRRTAAPSSNKVDLVQLNEFAAQVQLPQHVVYTVQGTYTKYRHAVQYTMRYSGHGTIFGLQRVQTDHCIVCESDHDSDNAYLRLRSNGQLSLHCHRSGIRAGVDIGTLDFADVMELEAAVGLQLPAASLAADTVYNTPFIKHNFLSFPDRMKYVDGEFVVARQLLPSLMICASTGSGKTTFMEWLVRANKGFKFIAVSCRRTLASMLAERLGFSNYQNIPKGVTAEDRVVVQAELLFRLDLKYYDGEDVILILDEFSSLCEQMCSTTTMGDGISPFQSRTCGDIWTP
ncbi:hypothetical protein BG011_004404 [Mortierella polycephala]|uniref:DNA-directed primase/polymerase protein n=1 Tax=Mortierella polycephala TaxID=41804 RepID=A0A9P6QCJ3_9FUNG|nr:hypothetical protein BG011_004404 [Mortierella polycephala]